MNEPIATEPGCYMSGTIPLSNFTLTCTRIVWNKQAKASIPGQVRRFVKFNNSGPEVELTARDIATVSSFRMFCYSMGPYHWHGGDKHLWRVLQLLDEAYGPMDKQNPPAVDEAAAQTTQASTCERRGNNNIGPR